MIAFHFPVATQNSIDSFINLPLKTIFVVYELDNDGSDFIYVHTAYFAEEA